MNDTFLEYLPWHKLRSIKRTWWNMTLLSTRTRKTKLIVTSTKILVTSGGDSRAKIMPGMKHFSKKYYTFHTAHKLPVLPAS